MKIGRNEPCPCGSGKKYKKCCQPKDQSHQREVTLREGEKLHREALARSRDPLDEGWQSPVIVDEEKEQRTTNRRKFPKVDETLPDLSSEDQKTVDHWWDEITPFYKKNCADEMLQRVNAFLEKHPELFIHLGLQEEFLFELGAELSRRKQWSVYTDLLKRLRRQQPEMYSFSFGFYDYSLIAECIVMNRVDEIPAYFDLFGKYPDSYPEVIDKLAALLAWQGLEETLYALSERVAVAMLTSIGVVNGGYSIGWLIFREHVPYLVRGDSSSTAVEAISKGVQELSTKLSLALKVQPAICQHVLELSSQSSAFDLNGLNGCNSQYIQDLGWNFTGFLEARHGTSWVKARMIAKLLQNYIRWSIRRHYDPTSLTAERMEDGIFALSQPMLCVDGVCALSMLQALVCFGEYLAENGVISKVKRQRIFCDGAILFENIRKEVQATDPAFRLVSSYERLW